MRGRLKFWVPVSALAVGLGLFVWRHESSLAPISHDGASSGRIAENPVGSESANAKRNNIQTEEGAKSATGKLTTGAPETPPVASTVPARMRFLNDTNLTILALSEQANWLSAPFSNAELGSVTRYLESTDLHGHTIEDDAAIRNGLMNALRRDHESAQSVRELFFRMARNNGLPVVFRDYAVQHLVSAFAGTQVPPALAELLEGLAADGEGSLKGTALVSMMRLAGSQSGAQLRDPLSYRSVLAAYDSQDVEAQITSLALAADLGQADALPAASEVLSSSRSVPARIAAIGTLGKLGSRKQLPALQSVLEGHEEYLKPAARTAIARINERNL
ncbi:hypothetical protein GC207_15510 [bacterium]|nr:hypothetical protein [bacterium]